MENAFSRLLLDLHRFPAPAATGAIAGAVLVLFLLGSALAQRFIRRLSTQGHLQPAMATRLQIIRRWAVGLVTPLIVLQATGMIQHAWTVISAVVAAVAIGFVASWSLLSNATSALLLLTFRPFRVGDVVDLVEPSNGSQMTGRVVDMNLMFTTLQEQAAGNGVPRGTLQVPNSLFFQKVVRVGRSWDSDSSVPFFAESQAPPVPPGTKRPQG